MLLILVIGGKKIVTAKPTLRPTVTKPPTVKERKLIRKYGSLQAAKQQEKRARTFAQQQAQSAVTQAKAQVQIDYKKMWDSAMNIYDRGHAGEYLAFMRLRDYKGKKRDEVATVRRYLKELVKQQRAGNIRSEDSLFRTPKEVAKQIANIEFFEKQKLKPEPKITPIMMGEVQPAPERGIIQRGVSGIKGYFMETYPGTRSPITGIREDIIPDISRIPEITKDVLVRQPEKDKFGIVKAPPIRTFVGPQELPLQEPTVTYLGGEEISIQEQPIFGTTMVGDVSGKRKVIDIRKISPDQRRSYLRRLQEMIPGAGVALTTLGEQVYLPDSASMKRYKKLIASGKAGAGKDVTLFLREQQAELKRDIGRYNALNLKMQSEKGLTNDEMSELNILYSKITRGQRGSGWEIVAEAGRQAEERGEKVKIFGQDVSPATARGALAGFVKAEQAAVGVLGFQVGAGIAGGILGATTTGASLLTGIGKVAKPLGYTVVPTGIGFGGVSGYRMFQETGDMPLALGSGIGTTVGFLAAGYGKSLFDVGGKVARKFNVVMTKPLSRVPLSASKKAEMDLFRRKGGSQYAKQALKKYQTEKSIDVKSIVKEKTFEDFVKYGKDSEVKKFIKDALTKLSKMNIPVAQKQQMAKNLLGRITSARGGVVITDASGNVLSVSGVPARPTVPVPRRPTVSPTERMAESVYAGTGQYERTGMMGLRLGSKVGQTPKQLLQLTDIAPKVTSLSGLSSISRTLQDQDQSPILGLSTLTMQQSMQQQKSFADIASLSATDTAQRFETTQAPRSLLDIKSKTGQVPINGLTGSIIRKPTRPRKPAAAKVPRIPPISFGLPRRTTQQMVSGQGYNASVLRAGPTGKKQWIKLDTQPITRESALSAGAREADTEIGARFKIDKVKDGVQGVQRFAGRLQDAMSKKVPKVGVLDTKDKYFRDNQKKFRMWRQKKGKRKATPNQFIERQKYRLDSPQERRTIQRAKITAPRKPRKKQTKMFRL